MTKYSCTYFIINNHTYVSWSLYHLQNIDSNCLEDKHKIFLVFFLHYFKNVEYSNTDVFQKEMTASVYKLSVKSARHCNIFS